MHLGIIKITYIYIYSSDAFKAVQLIQFELTAAPSENRWWRFTANHGTGFTVEMRMLIEFD